MMMSILSDQKHVIINRRWFLLNIHSLCHFSHPFHGPLPLFLQFHLKCFNSGLKNENMIPKRLISENSILSHFRVLFMKIARGNYISNPFFPEGIIN
jgi:hypothetical protein